MMTKLDFAIFSANIAFTQEQIIDHIIQVFHSDLTAKQALLIKYDLTIILNATFKLSQSIGFSKMTLRDLQKETGISTGSLYRCFSNKDELETMVAEGVNCINQHFRQQSLGNELTSDEYLALSIKGYVYLGQLFEPWYYFISMELPTMSEEAFHKVVKIRSDYLKTLSIMMKGNALAASHMSTIIQDFVIRKWKYINVDIDDFANHCVEVARLFNDNHLKMANLPLVLSD